MHSTTAPRPARETAFSLGLLATGACLVALNLVLIADPDVVTNFGRCLTEHQHLMDWLVLVPLVALYVDTCVGGAWHWGRLVLPLSVALAMIGGYALGMVELWQLAVVNMLAGGDLLAKQWQYHYRQR